VNITELKKEIKEEEAENSGFGDLYIDVRYKEKRVLSDGQVMFLPDIEANHIHFKEWQSRRRSAQRLVDYLKGKNRPLNILEIGCGNGWLSSKLLTVKNSKVTGLDINEPEIMQAKRVFQKDHLEFICGGFEPGMFKDQKFDVILFAASVQYFSSVKNILESAFLCLNKNGEIHIMDTNFYKPNEVANAAKRTEEYYEMLGYPEMAAHYFHHSINDLQPFNYKILFNPKRLINKISKKDPFYWVVVKH
jgi:ubiquinone/menaquinone biosynthesis C-methylase UbiE